MSVLRAQNSLVGLSTATSAQNAVRNGAQLTLGNVEPGSLGVWCHTDITTSSVVSTFTPQVSNDNGTTWLNIVMVSNEAISTSASGTGSQVVTDDFRPIDMPVSSIAQGIFRVNAKLSGAATNAADKTGCTYYWLRLNASR